ncbi:MAG TPA: hypothetical protein VLB87_06940 [Pyrinomonadaceae bacterium]|nr:hypothetical protein [Pyrinomonadaceae bacterium]
MKTSIYLLLALVTFASVAVGQSHKDRLEVGVHSTSLTVFDPDFPGDVTHTSVGGRVTYNLNRSFAVEAEVNFFPQVQLFSSAEGNSIQAQFGLKAGKRFEKFGIFAKLRPGFLSVDDFFTFRPGPVINGIPTLDFKLERTTLFTLDMGGVLEFYPSKRVVVRFEAGDTAIRYPRKSQPVFGGQTLVFVDLPPKFEQNFQFTAGVGFRLGDFPAEDANAATSASTSGSEGVPRYEIGAQFTSLFVDDPTNTCGFCLLRSPQRIHTEPGFGGRFTFNLTETFALEAEGNYYTRRLIDFPNPGGHMFQGQFGVKVGKRRDSWGWFVKVRPGFVGFTRVFELGNDGFFRPRDSRFVKKRFPSFDVGGVIEFYVSRHWIARFDVGDTIIRYAPQRTPQFITSMPVFTRPAETRHSLQVSSGIGFRF